MNTKSQKTTQNFIVLFLLLTCYRFSAIGQDTVKQPEKLNDARLELLEYNQKILDARINLLEMKQPAKKASFINTVTTHPVIAEQSNKIHADSSFKPFTQAITFSLNRIFEGTLQLGYEKALSRSLALDVSLMGTYVTKDGFGRGYLQNQELAYADEATNNYVYYSGNMIRSIGGTVRLKNYLLTRVNTDARAPIGLYAAPQLMYRRVWITGNQYVYDYYFAPTKEITRNLDIMQGGVIIGSKFTLAKVLCVDAYIGGVMRLSKYFNEKTFTRYKKWYNIDYSGILPTAGINIGILK